jgi:minichromosome maintenance protein 10
MHARYHLNPSQLYSIARPGKGNDMDVPVEGDFILIGVLAERSDIRVTAKPQQGIQKPPAKKKKVSKDEALPADAKDDEDLKEVPDDDGEEPSWSANRKPKRYVMFKLLDMRLKRGQSLSGGDSYLNVILFESDTTTTTFDESESETETTRGGVRVAREKRREKRKKETFRGGSGGAYERFWKENDGAVVAILNPKVLKPRPQPGKPHNNVLTITPDSAESILVIGKSMDLGTCPAVRRDGTVCGSSFDKRTHEACDFHVAAALKKTKSGRSELMTGCATSPSAPVLLIPLQNFEPDVNPGW